MKPMLIGLSRVAFAAGAVVVLLLFADEEATAAPYTVEPTLTQIAGAETRCYTTWDAADGAGYTIGGWYDDTPPTIGLPPVVCRRIAVTLGGGSSRDTWHLALRARAWHIFAHEVAHHRGFDHGEQTVGADCAGWRMLPRLLHDAGIERAYRRLLHFRATPYAHCP